MRPSCRILAPVPVTITSDLPGLRARPFSMNHWCTARKQLSSDVTALSRSSMYNWVSSAYWVWWTPNEEITPAIGATYVVIRALVRATNPEERRIDNARIRTGRLRSEQTVYDPRDMFSSRGVPIQWYRMCVPNAEETYRCQWCRTPRRDRVKRSSIGVSCRQRNTRRWAFGVWQIL